MVDASAELRALGVRLKAEGASGLRLEMLRGLKESAAPLVPLVKQAAVDQLPKGGGLNQQVAGQRVTVSVSTSARSAGVRLKTTAPDTQQTDSGFVRHPVFGKNNNRKWQTQSIPAAVGWWSQTLAKESGLRVTAGLVLVIRRVNSRIERGM
jgi:hypothetical protein